MRVRLDTISIATLVILAIGLAVLAYSLATEASEPIIILRDGDVEQVLVTERPGDGCAGVGYGVVYGPREARQSIVVWDCCGEFFLAITEHGAPEKPEDPRGPVVAKIWTLLPQEAYEFLRDQLNDPEQCVAVLP